MDYIKLPKKYTTTKIKSISFDYNVPTYDIEVENSHYYNLSNGIISHNTISLMFRTMPMSYGIEPAFGIYYWKRTRISGEYKYYFVVPNVIREIFTNAGYKIPMKSDTIIDTWDGKHGKPIVDFINEHKDKLDIKFKNSTEVAVNDKLDLMTKIMNWIDSSISVTYILQEESKIKDVYDLILNAYKNNLKSLTVYRDRKMYGIISFTPFKEQAFNLKQDGIEIHSQNFNDKELKELNFSRNYISYSDAPKRPKILDADIYSVTVKGEKFVVAIGLLNGAPYEIFCGKMNGLQFKFNHKNGSIEKIKRGVYRLSIGDDIVVEDFARQFTPEEQILFRLVSTNMRHGVPTKFTIEQLSKAVDDITSLSSAAIRVLKKYIKTGESVTGLSCNVCGSQLVYDEDCIKCIKCGWSKCS